MSPRSRGRPPARGGARPRTHKPQRTPTAAERVIADAADLAREGVLAAEIFASAQLGWAWASAPAHDPAPELRLLRAVAERALARPGLSAAAAVTAMVRLMDPATPGLAEVTAGLPPAPWPATPWVPVRARRAADVYGSASVLLVQFDGPERHVLMAGVEHSTGRWVQALEVLEPKGMDTPFGQGDDPFGPAQDCPVDEALADLADAMRDADLSWPRPDFEYFGLRALAWSRCRGHLRGRAAYEPMPEAERAELVSAFVRFADVPDNKVTRTLAGRFVDFGDAWLPDGPLSWSPQAVDAFFEDELSRGQPLDDDELDELPDVLAEFVRFALTRRGVAEQWVEEAVDAVDDAATEEDDLDPARAGEVLSTLIARGVDISDEAAVERGLLQILEERGDIPPSDPF